MDRLSFNQQLADMARRIADDLTETNRHSPPSGSERRTTLDKVVMGPVDLIENCSLAGASVIRYRQSASPIVTPAASDDEARLVDQLQHDLGEGPLIELRHEDTVISGNVDTDNRWPRWGALVSDQYRIRSAMAFRLFADGRSLGALSMYSEKPDAFTGNDVVDALALAGQTGIALAAALELDHMHAALRSRHVIGQAVGIVRERFTLTEDQAFNVLKRLSSQQNAKLVAVASQIVDTGDLPQLAVPEG